MFRVQLGPHHAMKFGTFINGEQKYIKIWSKIISLPDNLVGYWQILKKYFNENLKAFRRICTEFFLGPTITIKFEASNNKKKKNIISCRAASPEKI